MQRIFIVNPTSGKGKSLDVIKYIETQCKLKNYDYKIFYTEKKNDAKLIAEHFKNSYSIVINTNYLKINMYLSLQNLSIFKFLNL